MCLLDVIITQYGVGLCLFFLFGKNKLDFVEGSVLLPSDLELDNKWNRCNAVVMPWILNLVDKSLYSNLVFYMKALDVWAYLCSIYCKIDGTRLFNQLQEISKIN